MNELTVTELVGVLAGVGVLVIIASVMAFIGILATIIQEIIKADRDG